MGEDSARVSGVQSICSGAGSGLGTATRGPALNAMDSHVLG